jgi:DNA repair photolyase
VAQLQPPPPGRGARSNRSGRFEPLAVEAVDDGWRVEDPQPEQAKTSVTLETPRTIITRNASPDLGFDRSINPYRGCEHGCVYCYARPTHAYMGLSPGLDFETRLFAKLGAAKLLEAELAKPGYAVKPIALGTNTDPYQPIERRHAITRQILEVLLSTRHPVTITTKSNLVVRDIDILSEMAKLNLVRVAVSVTTLERRLARAMEPRAPTPERRLEAIRALSEAGVPAAVMVAPVIPGLTDHEMEAILERAAAAGARAAGFILLRLPLEIKDLVREWLEAHQPNRAGRVFTLLRSMRGGKDYDAAFGKRMKGEGPYAMMLAKRFALATERLGLDKPAPPLETSLFAPPRKERAQLSLF